MSVDDLVEELLKLLDVIKIFRTHQKVQQFCVKT